MFHCSRDPAGGFASGYHGLAALPKRGKRRETGSVHERNKHPGGNLPPRPLAVRARADAGLLRQYQRETRRRRLAGDADQRLARFARPGADVAARAGWTAGFRRRSDQGGAAAHRALPDTRFGACRRASSFDPFGGAVDAARDRPPRRTAADDAVLPDEMRPHRARALLSARRSGRRRCDQGAGREILVRAARQSRAGGVGRYAGSGGVRDRGTRRDGEALSAAARVESALSVAGTGEGFDEDVRADAAGAWAHYGAIR